MIFANANNLNRDSIFSPVDRAVTLDNLIYDDESDSIALKESFISLHHAIMCDSVEIVQEGLTDFFKSAWEYFKALAKKIYDFIANVIRYMLSYFMKFESFIEKYQDNIDKFEEFKVSGYKYTINDDDIDTTGVEKIIDSYNANANNIEKKSLADIQELVDKDLNGNVLNEMRGKIVGKGGSIKANNFHKELQKKYRDGSSITKSITITSDVVRDYINDFKEFKSKIDSVKEEGYNIQELFTSMADFFHSLPDYEYTDTTTKKMKQTTLSANPKTGELKIQDNGKQNYSADHHKKYIIYFNCCYRTCKEYAAMYSIAYREKINAMKEAIDFYKNVIRRALNPFGDLKDTIKEAFELTDYVQDGRDIMYECDRQNYLENFCNYINEINFITQSSLRGYLVMEDVEVNESETTKKSTLQNIIFTIKKIVNMFLTKAKRLFSDNKTFLETEAVKIKDVPDSTFANITISMFQYDKNNTSVTKMPPCKYDKNKIKELIASGKKEPSEIAKEIYPDLMKLTTSTSHTAAAKVWFHGKTDVLEKFTGSAAKAEALKYYDWCLKYMDVYNAIKEQVDSLENDMNAAVSKYESLKESYSDFIMLEDSPIQDTEFILYPVKDKYNNFKHILTEAEEKVDKAKVKKEKEESKAAAKNVGVTTTDNDGEQNADKGEDKKKKIKKKKANAADIVAKFYKIQYEVAVAMMTAAEERYYKYIETLRDIIDVAGIASDENTKTVEAQKQKQKK